MASATRIQALCLYKRLLRTAQRWEASSGKSADTQTEKEYICNETKKLFQKNRHVTEEGDVRMCIQEGETRLGMAMHYRTPYPRPVNIPYGGLPPSVGKGKKAQDRLRKQAKPIYIKSYDEY